MKVYKSHYLCNAALVNSENPLPQFRDKNTNFEVINTESVPKEYSNLLGFECGKRIYPYKKQDGYNRDCKECKIPSIILENEYLKATFLPTLGARLISLFDKENSKELLFSNKNIQMGNLAIRDAWFSGGIEWNIGQYGHSLTTCDDVFVSKQKDQNDNEFIRIYEFERMHEIYWHIDFHLPKNSKMLFAKAFIYNFNSSDTSLYCWTNSALRTDLDTRVFSNTKNALFLNPSLKDDKKGYDYVCLPYVDMVKGLDISYPKRFQYSNEYFFTSNHSNIPYEVTIDKNGDGFFDISTNSLGYRKMFCWGEQPGGKHWQSFLSPTTSGAYFEAQAGISPSQLHGEILKGNSSFTFTQAFGSLHVDKRLAQDKVYDNAFKYIKKAVKHKLKDLKLDLYVLDEQFSKDALIEPEEILHKGSGFGYLNSLKVKYTIPKSFIFKKSDVKSDENIYINLINNKMFDFDYLNLDFQYPPTSYQNLFKDSDIPFCKYLDAVIDVENLNFDKAIDKFLDLDKSFTNCLICRNLAVIYINKKDVSSAIYWYEKAFALSTKKYFRYICEEYSKILIENNLLDEARILLNKLDKQLFEISDSLVLDLALISAHFGDLDSLKYCLFNRELANIREGANPFPYLYYEFKALERAKENNTVVSDEIRDIVRSEFEIPFELDFTVLLEE